VTAVLAFVLVVVAIACDSDRAPAPRIDVTEVEAAVRAFEDATIAADAEALFSLTTDAYIAANFEAFGVTRADIEQFPDRHLGGRIRREIDGIDVADDRATVLGWIRGRGTKDSSAVEVRLVRREGAWLVDYTGPRRADPPPGSRVVEVGIREFAFAFDPAAFTSQRPLVIRATNSGRQQHIAVLWAAPPGMTGIQLIEATDNPPPELEQVAASITFNPGESGDVVIPGHLEPGRYLLICTLFDTDVPERTPHYDRGMLVDFEIR
jgi:hypothetical protein